MDNSSYEFLELESILALHQKALNDYGGEKGIRDKNLLLSALNQPKNVHHYTKANIFEIAANYGYHLCKNHAFNDGNKRIGYLAMKTFLRLNDYKLQVDVEERKEIMFVIENGTINKQELSRWIENNSIEL